MLQWRRHRRLRYVVGSARKTLLIQVYRLSFSEELSHITLKNSTGERPRNRKQQPGEISAENENCESKAIEKRKRIDIREIPSQEQSELSEEGSKNVFPNQSLNYEDSDDHTGFYVNGLWIPSSELQKNTASNTAAFPHSILRGVPFLIQQPSSFCPSTCPRFQTIHAPDVPLHPNYFIPSNSHYLYYLTKVQNRPEEKFLADDNCGALTSNETYGPSPPFWDNQLLDSNEVAAAGTTTKLLENSSEATPHRVHFIRDQEQLPNASVEEQVDTFDTYRYPGYAFGQPVCSIPLFPILPTSVQLQPAAPWSIAHIQRRRRRRRKGYAEYAIIPEKKKLPSEPLASADVADRETKPKNHSSQFSEKNAKDRLKEKERQSTKTDPQLINLETVNKNPRVNSVCPRTEGQISATEKRLSLYTANLAENVLVTVKKELRRIFSSGSSDLLIEKKRNIKKHSRSVSPTTRKCLSISKEILFNIVNKVVASQKENFTTPSKCLPGKVVKESHLLKTPVSSVGEISTENEADEKRNNDGRMSDAKGHENAINSRVMTTPSEVSEEPKIKEITFVPNDCNKGIDTPHVNNMEHDNDISTTAAIMSDSCNENIMLTTRKSPQRLQVVAGNEKVRTEDTWNLNNRVSSPPIISQPARFSSLESNCSTVNQNVNEREENGNITSLLSDFTIHSSQETTINRDENNLKPSKYSRTCRSNSPENQIASSFSVVEPRSAPDKYFDFHKEDDLFDKNINQLSKSGNFRKEIGSFLSGSTLDTEKQFENTPPSPQSSFVPHSVSSDALIRETELELSKLHQLTSHSALHTNQSIYKLAYDENITDQSETEDVDVITQSTLANGHTCQQSCRALQNDGSRSEILVHEADSGSDAGSEDVELLPHRYQSESIQSCSKHIYVNNLSLAVEMLRTRENLPYDEEFKRIVDDGNEGNIGFPGDALPFQEINLNTASGRVNPGFVNESYYEETPKRTFETLSVQKPNQSVTTTSLYDSGNRNHRKECRTSIADSGVQSEDSGDEVADEAKETFCQTKVTLNNELRGSNRDGTMSYRRFGNQTRQQFNVYTPRTGIFNPCLCCIVM